ncbi:MAG: hypothetical protein AAF480_11745 [Actinomycetota bacterium]
MTRISSHRIAVFAALAMSIAIVGGVIAPHGGAGDESDPALGALTPLTAPEAEIVGEALALFDGAGLTLGSTPAVSFHDDKADCAGNLGFWVDESGLDRIRVCWTHEDPVVQTTLQTQALVHELAHAWAHRQVDGDDRAAFSAFVGAAGWEAHDAAWVDRGTEVAAELVTWAVLDPAVSFIDFDAEPCTDWAEAFELLTGAVAPTHVGSDCG